MSDSRQHLRTASATVCAAVEVLWDRASEKKSALKRSPAAGGWDS